MENKKLLVFLVAFILFGSFFVSARESVKPSFIILLDVSGSMDETIGGVMRIDIAKDVLDKTIDEQSGQANFGFLSFPSSSGLCNVNPNLDIPLSSENENQIKIFSRSLDTLYHGTPISGAINTTTHYLKNQVLSNKNVDYRDKLFVVLITDGEPNCRINNSFSSNNHNQEVLFYVSQLRSLGVDVRTFIVGFDIQGDFLEEIAVVGGTQNALYAQDSDSLDLALSTVFSTGIKASKQDTLNFGECISVGSFGEGYYCDASKQKKELKSLGSGCLNDFECLSGRCIESFCSSRTSLLFSEEDEEENILNNIFNFLVGRECDPNGEYICSDSSNLSTCKFKCLDGDKNSYICGANGKWLSKGVLAFNVCPECSPGAVNCSGNVLVEKCNANGVWEDVNSRVVGLCNYDCVDQSVTCSKGKVNKFCNNGTWENKNKYISGKCSFYNISSWTLKSALSTTELKQGKQRILKVGEKIGFDVLETTHSIGVTNILDKLVSFELKSDPEYFTLEEGDIRKFNLNGDGYYDLQLTLNDVSEDSANFTIKEINELIKKSSGSTTTTTTTTPGGTPAPVCTPDWSCLDWSDFENSCGTRTCTDLNDCGVNTGKPITSKTCTGSRPFCGDGNCDSDLEEDSKSCPEDCEPGFPMWGIYVLIGTLVISLIAVIIIFSLRSKNKGEVLSLNSFKSNKPSPPGNSMQKRTGPLPRMNKPQQMPLMQRPPQKPMPAPPRKENNSGLK